MSTGPVRAEGPTSLDPADPLAEAAALLRSAGPGDVLRAMVSGGLRDLGVTAGIMYLVQRDGWLRLEAVYGYNPSEAGEYRLVPPDSPYPVAVAVRESRSVHQLLDELPDIAAQRRVADMSFVAVPMFADGRCVGAILLEVQRGSALTPEEYARMESAATICAYRVAVHVPGRPPAEPTPGAPPRFVDIRDSRLDQAMTSADVGAFEWYKDRDVLLWDERVCRIFGVDPQDPQGRQHHFRSSIHPDDRPMVEAALQAAVDTRNYAARYRIIRRSDGAVRWLDSRGRMRYDGHGTPVSLAGVVRDVTGEEEGRRLTRAATDAFAGALHVQDVADAVVDTVMPQLNCSALAVHLLDGEDLILAAARGYPPETLDRLRTPGPNSPMGTAMRLGRTLYLRDRRAFLREFPDTADRPTERHNSWVVMPLSTVLGPVGTCTMSYLEPHSFTEDDTSRLEGLAGILAQSLARAGLFELYHRQMDELQAMLLPRRLTPGAGVTVAVRYVPGSENLDVGGDWYDVVPLPNGRTAVVVGDVQGHNASAAAVMGQLRTAVRAYAAEGHDPASVMSRTNRMLCDLDTDLFATALYAEVDPVAGTATLVRAGHSSPLSVACDGTVRELDVEGGLLLGLDAAQEYPAPRVALRPGEALMFWTDGLVERRDLEYDEALTDLVDDAGTVLRDLVAHGAHVPELLELVADHVLARVPDSAARDDIAVLLVAVSERAAQQVG